jgi:transcriptional regulator with XRE-family HTH domain
MKSIGRAARQARRARKLTQEDVADRVGVSTQFYGRIERGYALPSVTTLRRMLEVLDLRADELLGALDIGDVAADEGSSAGDVDPQLAQDMESPRLRRLMRFLRRASPVTLQVVEVLLDAMDKAGALRRARDNAGDGEPPDEEKNQEKDEEHDDGSDAEQDDDAPDDNAPDEDGDD